MSRAALAAMVIALGLGACSSSGDSGEAATTTATTVSTTTRPAATTVQPAPTTTIPVVTQPVPTAPTTAPLTTSSKPDPGTTTAGPSCDAATLFAVLQATTALPAGTGADTPRCAAAWASMVVGAPNQDRALAVFTFDGSATWRLANLGTDGVCSDAGVPPTLYAALACEQWETG